MYKTVIENIERLARQRKIMDMRYRRYIKWILEKTGDVDLSNEVFEFSKIKLTSTKEVIVEGEDNINYPLDIFGTDGLKTIAEALAEIIKQR